MCKKRWRERPIWLRLAVRSETIDRIVGSTHAVEARQAICLQVGDRYAAVEDHELMFGVGAGSASS
jgi:hypothetical protein